MVWTGLAFLPIHKMMVLVAAFGPIGCEEVSDTRPATGNRSPEDRLHRVIELQSRGPAEVTDVPIRMQTGSKENLIRIDIPDSRNDILMH